MGKFRTPLLAGAVAGATLISTGIIGKQFGRSEALSQAANAQELAELRRKALVARDELVAGLVQHVNNPP